MSTSRPSELWRTALAATRISADSFEKKVIGNADLAWIVEPGELRHFYRTPTQCWRGRYQAVKAVADFKLDIDKLVKQDRYKSHAEAERGDFAKSAQAFALVWSEVAKPGSV